jgi:type III secretory pathway component EscV
MKKDGTLAKLLGHSDLIAAVGVVLIVTMLIIPLPAVLLDLLITLNISIALAVVVATMYLGKRWTSRPSRACCCSPRCSVWPSTSRSPAWC